jgi:3-hexulose-6-phosphate synthase
MPPTRNRRPLILLGLDFPTVQHAAACARLGIEAGVDLLGIGTALLLAEGLKTVGHLKRSFPDYPIWLDVKAMDSAARGVHLAQTHGAQYVTVCGNAPDETVQAAVAAGRGEGARVVADLIGCKDVVGRAFQCQEWGADLVFLSYGADEWRADPTRDATRWIEPVRRAVSIPIGVSTYSADEGVRAAQAGAALVAIGHPLISADEPLAALGEYVRKVRAAVGG